MLYIKKIIFNFNLQIFNIVILDLHFEQNHANFTILTYIRRKTLSIPHSLFSIEKNDDCWNFDFIFTKFMFLTRPFEFVQFSSLFYNNNCAYIVTDKFWEPIAW